MKKEFVLLVFNFLLVSTAMAQQFGVKGGISLNNTYEDISFYETENLMGYVTGVSFSEKLSKSFIFETELLFMKRGFDDEITFTDEQGEFIGIGKTHFKHDYLSVPLKLGYTIGKNASVTFYLGIMPAYLLNSKIIYPITVNGNASINSTVEANRFDLAGIGEVEGSYPITEKIKGFVSFSYNHSFTSVSNEDYVGVDDFHLYGFVFSAGIKYRLKSKP